MMHQSRLSYKDVRNQIRNAKLFHKSFFPLPSHPHTQAKTQTFKKSSINLTQFQSNIRFLFALQTATINYPC